MKLSEEMYVKLEPLINCGADVNELDDLKEWLLPKVIELEKESEKKFIDYDELIKIIIPKKIKSEYMQSAFIIFRNAFKEAGYTIKENNKIHSPKESEVI